MVLLKRNFEWNSILNLENSGYIDKEIPNIYKQLQG